MKNKIKYLFLFVLFTSFLGCSDFLEEDPVVKVSKKAFNKEAVSQLSKQESWALTEVKRLLLK
jgi:hypothetical protein